MFLLNVARLFGHGIVSFAIGVVRFGFSLGVVAGFVGVIVFGIQWLVLDRPRSIGQAGLSLCIAFLCFAASVALATRQRQLRQALDRSIVGGATWR